MCKNSQKQKYASTRPQLKFFKIQLQIWFFYFITQNKYEIARSILPKLLIIKDKTYCIKNS